MAKDATAVASPTTPATLSPTSPSSSTGVDSAIVIVPILRRDHPRDRLGNPSPYWPLIANEDQIPAWLRDNEYILTGHPMPTHSYRRSWRLWRCLHMETMNIWTHLLGSTAFLATGAALYRHVSDSSVLHLTTGDKFAFGAFLTSASVCFGLSTTFHTLRSHSYRVHHFWGTMDILGICVLVLGGGTSLTYYAFYCQPTVQRVYWGLSLASATAAALTVFDTGGGGSKRRALRAGVFGLLTLSAMLPLLHRTGEIGWARACEEIGAAWYVGEALALVTGVSMFASRIPERLSPGTFDIWGHSHQLHHICAVLGGAFHVMGLVTGYRYRQSHPLC